MARALGGIIGANEGKVEYVESKLRIIGVDAHGVGGLAGEASGIIEESHALGAVSGGKYAGGLVGIGGIINNSYATGTVVGGAKSTIGGLAGSAVEIMRSHASGTVIGDGREIVAGGLVGAGIDIGNSYALGSVIVEGKSYAGGLAGTDQRGSVRFSYAIGAVSGEGDDIVGGFFGRDVSRHTADDYWNVDIDGMIGGCGQGDCSGVSGIATQQLKSGLPPGFNPAIWSHDPNINTGFPYLRVEQKRFP